MPLTNADIQFCNTYVRPYADWRAKDYLLAKRLVTTWNARGGAVAAQHADPAGGGGGTAVAIFGG